MTYVFGDTAGYQDKMQAMIARPVACRSPTVAFQTTQAVRPRVLARTSRRSVLTRAEPSAVSGLRRCCT